MGVGCEGANDTTHFILRTVTLTAIDSRLLAVNREASVQKWLMVGGESLLLITSST